MTDPAALIDRQKALANALFVGWPNLGIPGLPWKSCAATVGNATRENRDKSVTAGTLDHGSNGIFQWRDSSPPPSTGARLTNMQAWTTANFGTWQSIPAQAAFFAYECMTQYQALWADLVAGTERIETLTLNICDAYERPSVAGRVPDIRIGFATAFLVAAPTPVSAPLPRPAPMPARAPVPPIYVPPPLPAPLPLPAPGGAITLSPAIIALLEQVVLPALLPAFLPLVQKVIASPAVETALIGLVNSWAQQYITLPTTAPAAPAIAPAALATTIAEQLLPQLIPAVATALTPAAPVLDLASIVEQIVAGVVAKQVAPPTTGAKAA